jgi:hypothetical protein
VITGVGWATRPWTFPAGRDRGGETHYRWSVRVLSPHGDAGHRHRVTAGAPFGSSKGPRLPCLPLPLPVLPPCTTPPPVPRWSPPCARPAASSPRTRRS